MSSIAASMIRGSLWITGARAAMNAISFVGTIVLARLLLPEDFGLIALGMTILAIVGAVTDLSLSQALVQHRDPRDEHFHTAFTLNFARGLALSMLICAAAHPLARFYGDRRLESLLYALSISVILGGAGNPRTVMLSRQLVFWQDFLLGVSNRFVTVLVSVLTALIYRNFWALVVGAVAGQLAGVILSYALMPFRPRIALTHARELWGFSFWLTLSQGMNTINWRFDPLLVGRLLGRSALGFYSVGDNLAQTVTREATAPLTRTLFPAFARIADDPHRLRAGYDRAQRLVTAIALPVGVGFAFVATPFVLATMGQKWLPAVPVIQGLSANFAFQTLGSLAAPLGLAKGESKLLFRRDCQIFLMRVPLLTAGMILWGLPGLIYARVFGTGIGVLINLLFVRQFIGVGVMAQIRANGRSISAVTMMSGVLLAIGRYLPHTRDSIAALTIEIASIAITGAAIYILSSILLWMAAGRPRGPEQEVSEMLAKFLSRRAHTKRA